MKDLVNWDRPEKGVSRSFAMGYEGITHHTILDLPAHSNLCLEEGLEEGTIDENSEVIAADNNPDNWIKTERFLRRNFKKYYYHKGDIEDLLLAKIIAENNFGDIDFSFLDLCGHLCPSRVKWLFESRTCFTSNCRFGLTVSAAQRWMKQWEKTICNTATEMLYSQDLETLLIDAKNNFAKDIVGLPIDVNKRQKLKKNRITEFTNVIKSIKASCSIFMMAMNNFDMEINRVYRYKESNDSEKHTEMVFADFRFCGNNTADDICLDVIEEFKSSGYYSNRKKKHGAPKIILKNAYDIARYMGIFGDVESSEDLSAGKKAGITRISNSIGLDSDKVLTKIEKRLQKHGLNA